MNAAAGYVIGAKVTETEVIAVLTDLEATVIRRRTRKLSGNSVDNVVTLIGKMVDDLRSKIPDEPLYGLGVGTARWWTASTASSTMARTPAASLVLAEIFQRRRSITTHEEMTIT